MTENEFIKTQMIPGHRYAQRFTTITERICHKEDLDRELTDFAKTHIVVSLSPYVYNDGANVIVGYLADLTEERIKEETKATIRCIPYDAPEEEGKCIYSGKPSHRRVVFARSY